MFLASGLNGSRYSIAVIAKSDQESTMFIQAILLWYGHFTLIWTWWLLGSGLGIPFGIGIGDFMTVLGSTELWSWTWRKVYLKYLGFLQSPWAQVSPAWTLLLQQSVAVMAAWAHITPYLALLTQASRTNCSTLSLGNLEAAKDLRWAFCPFWGENEQRQLCDKTKKQKNRQGPKIWQKGAGVWKTNETRKRITFFFFSSFLPSRAHISQIFNFQSLNKKVY